jgi:fermentation-respiration switch protein FrsA (DUF1100 family)
MTINQADFKGRRKVTVILLALPVLVVVVIAVLSFVVYLRLATVTARCGARAGEGVYTPAEFYREGFDTRPYWMPTYEEVTFASRDANITLSGFYLPAAPESSNGKAVVIVHGFNDCKRRPQSLVPASMLHQNGFTVLVMDLRDHGDSTVEDGRMSAGTEEYRDVLGAWDWLVQDKNFRPESIGLYGYSLGGSSSLLALAMEPRVAAVWEDSAFSDFSKVIESELAKTGLPLFLGSTAQLVGRIFFGDDIYAYSPARLLRDLNGRSIYIVHGDQDKRVSVQAASEIRDTASQYGTVAGFWITSGTAHIESIFDYSDEYNTRLVEFFANALR